MAACAVSVAVRILIGFSCLPGLFLAGLCLIEISDSLSCTKTFVTPAVLRVVGKESRIKLRKSSAAAWAGPFRRQHAATGGGVAGFAQRKNLNNPLSELERGLQQGFNCRFLIGFYDYIANGQLDRMLFEAIKFWKRGDRYKLAINS